VTQTIGEAMASIFSLKVSGVNFDDVVVDADAQGFDNVVFGGVGRDHENRRVLHLVEAPQGADELDAVHLRHVPVGDHHVRVGDVALVDAFTALARLDHLGVAELVERVDDDSTHRRGIVDHEKAHDGSVRVTGWPGHGARAVWLGNRRLAR
jgi:hypothetical protein